MTPLARNGLLVGIVLALTLSVMAPALAQDPHAADLGVPADAPAPATGKVTRVITFGVIEAPAACPNAAPQPCFDQGVLVANPGDVVVLHGNFLNSDTPHNIDAKEGLAAPVKSTVGGAKVHTISFVMPDGKDVTVVCDLHASMQLKVTTPEKAAASSGTKAVNTLGVHFLAYWVGVIAFAILFLVYGLTFFLFKYNETSATTDHHDRGEEKGDPRLAAAAPILAVVIAIVMIGAVIFIATR